MTITEDPKAGGVLTTEDKKTVPPCVEPANVKLVSEVADVPLKDIMISRVMSSSIRNSHRTLSWLSWQFSWSS